jgi:hypothetical protein
MLKGAFFLGGKTKESYPDVARVDPDGYIVWGKRIPENFTANIRTQIPSWHKNKIDFSQITSIGANNFNDNFMFGDLTQEHDKLELPSLESLGENCFNDMGLFNYLIVPKIKSVKNCFNRCHPWNIKMGGLQRVEGNSFNNLRTGDYLSLPSLESITGTGSFCNFPNVFGITFKKLKSVSAGNFLNVDPRLSQFGVSSSIDSASESNLRSSLGSSVWIRKW